MKNLSFVIFSLLINSSLLFSQECEKTFKNSLESKSKIIYCSYNETIEKLPNSKVVFKRYALPTKQITLLITAPDASFEKKDGLFLERYDDGVIIDSGIYVQDMKQGFWIENQLSFGIYNEGLKNGEWTTLNEDSVIISKETYANGIWTGDQYYYTNEGELKEILTYKDGKFDSQQIMIEEIITEPNFSGCKDSNLSSYEIQQCSNRKMLEYIYGSILYPEQSREKSIQGDGRVRIKIDEQGQVKDITVLNGINPELAKEMSRVIKKMPQWTPATKNGQPINYTLIIPIKFRIVSGPMAGIN